MCRGRQYLRYTSSSPDYDAEIVNVTIQCGNCFSLCNAAWANTQGDSCFSPAFAVEI